MEQRWLVVITISSIYICVHCLAYRPSFEMFRIDPQGFKAHYCGDKLSNMLSVLCKGEYNSNRQSKKSMNDAANPLEYNDVRHPFDFDDNQYEYPFLPKETANAILPIMKFRKRGIIEECCTNACSVDELLGYCKKY